LFGPDGAKAAIHYTPRFVTGDMVALLRAAVAGVGIVQLPTMMIRGQVAQGTLVHVLNDWRPRHEIIHVVFPSRRGLLPLVRTLIDYLVARFQALEED